MSILIYCKETKDWRKEGNTNNAYAHAHGPAGVTRWLADGFNHFGVAYRSVNKPRTTFLLLWDSISYSYSMHSV
jgi:hypothetical protein